MSKLLFACLTLMVFGTLARAQEGNRMQYAIAIHGGGGDSDAQVWKQQRVVVLTEALQRGTDLLKSGASSLDVVERVVHVLEDSPLFNAGKGAVFNAAGEHELDATIMDGRTRSCGAVGAVRTVRNPISLARLVMTETPHILLVADGAERFADEIGASHGLLRVENSYFSTDSQRAKLKSMQEKAAAGKVNDSMGTVGCVVLDTHGNLAAGTSTGGMTNKRFGRLGDSPIVGAGTYADNRTCAISCTGVGEDFIRYAVAFDVHARMRHGKESLENAVHAVLHDPDQRVRGGAVAIDRQGRISMQYNTSGMSRAAADSSGHWEVHAAD